MEHTLREISSTLDGILFKFQTIENQKLRQVTAHEPSQRLPATPPTAQAPSRRSRKPNWQAFKRQAGEDVVTVTLVMVCLFLLLGAVVAAQAGLHWNFWGREASHETKIKQYLNNQSQSPSYLQEMNFGALTIDTR